MTWSRAARPGGRGHLPGRLGQAGRTVPGPLSPAFGARPSGPRRAGGCLLSGLSGVLSDSGARKRAWARWGAWGAAGTWGLPRRGGGGFGAGSVQGRREEAQGVCSKPPGAARCWDSLRARTNRGPEPLGTEPCSGVRAAGPGPGGVSGHTPSPALSHCALPVARRQAPLCRTPGRAPKGPPVPRRADPGASPKATSGSPAAFPCVGRRPRPPAPRPL